MLAFGAVVVIADPTVAEALKSSAMPEGEPRLGPEFPDHALQQRIKSR